MLQSYSTDEIVYYILIWWYILHVRKLDWTYSSSQNSFFLILGTAIYSGKPKLIFVAYWLISYNNV